MRFKGRLLKLLLLSAFAGCGFTPGEAGPPSGSGTGNGGNNGGGAAMGNPGSGNTGVGLQTGGGGDVGMTGGNCGQASVPIEAVPPDVLIVEDKSGSMDEDDNGSNCNGGSCGANSKWSQMVSAVSSVVTSTDTQINWGLKFFSDDNACDASHPPVVAVGSGAGMSIARQFQMTSPNGNTPTRDAVATGAAYLAGLTDNNPKYMLLATDGLPNCPVGCAGMSRPMGNCTQTDNPSEDMAATQAIADALSMHGIKTFVIGVGNVSTAQNTLNNFAMAGGLPQSGAATSYYAATDPQALENALTALVGAVFSCTVSLAGAPAGVTNVKVSAADQSMGGKNIAIAQDPANGWSFDANHQNILLNGDSCNKLKNGTYTDLNFVYACEGTVICIDKNPDGTCGDHV
jgi:hypothetical protein